MRASIFRLVVILSTLVGMFAASPSGAANYILIEKLVVNSSFPAASPTQAFTFVRDYNTSPFQLRAGQYDYQITAPVGIHSIQEQATLNYQLVGIQCDLSMNAKSKVTFSNAGLGSDTVWKPGDDTVKINLAQGETVECRFLNQTSNCASNGCQSGVCNISTGMCVPCLGDNDCASGQTCNTTTNQCETPPPPTCTVDAQCSNGQICLNGTCTPGCDQNSQCVSNNCDLSTHTCVPPPPCTTDSQCGSGQICLNGSCTPGCDQNNQCVSNQCDLSTHNCVPPPTCSTDGDCASGQICLNGSCTPGCDQNSQCSSNNCDLSTHTCVPPPSCSADTDCDSGQICLNGTCTPGCDQNSQCTSNSCDLSTHTCVPPPTCSSDTDCASGEICLNGTCAPGCDQDNQCVSNQCELSTHNCVPPPACTMDSQCGSGQICLDGSCTPGCDKDNQCSNGQVCNTNTHQCVTPPPPTCSSDSQCESGQICVNGTCTPGCHQDNQCPSNQICDTSTNQCVTPPPQCQGGCPPGDVCSGGVCIVACGDAVVESPEQCDNGSLNGVPGNICTDVCQCEFGVDWSTGRCTVPPTNQCTGNFAFWKTHNNIWQTLTSLKLGNAIYTQAQLEDILTSPIQGDASMDLARELIAALLNKLSGAPSDASVNAAISAAQNLFKNHGGKLPYNVDNKSAEGKAMKDLTQTLQQFNNHAQIPGSRCGKDKDVSTLSATSASAPSGAASGGCNSTGNALGTNATVLFGLALSLLMLRRRLRSKER